MHILGLVGGPDTDVASLRDELAKRLSTRGRVATIERTADDAANDVHSIDGAASSYYLEPDGKWFAAGESRSPQETIDTLTPRYDYLLVSGIKNLNIPFVIIGDGECDGDVLTEASDGGAVDVDGVIDSLETTEPYETLESLVARVKTSPRAELAGAIATFTGRVRAKEHDDDAPTEYLEFESYGEIVDQRLDGIREDLEARDGVHEVLLYHRIGVVEAGEDIVFVVVLAGHRAEAFKTVKDGINRLKAEVPIFKKEVTIDDEYWVHSRP